MRLTEFRRISRDYIKNEVLEDPYFVLAGVKVKGKNNIPHIFEIITYFFLQT